MGLSIKPKLLPECRFNQKFQRYQEEVIKILVPTGAFTELSPLNHEQEDIMRFVPSS